MPIDWQGSPADQDFIDLCGRGRRQIVSSDSQHSLCVRQRRRLSGKMRGALSEPHRVCDIIGCATLLSDHQLAVVSLMKMNAWSGNDSVNKAGEGLGHHDNTGRRSLRNRNAREWLCCQRIGTRSHYITVCN
jgi:hypothetical protein